ncbi:MAG TPA: hypothetical protein VL961_02775, partial [Acidimicrobiales bacterium]|nr:hypothetical protein [Acidimicrobiales bacterium]
GTCGTSFALDLLCWTVGMDSIPNRDIDHSLIVGVSFDVDGYSARKRRRSATQPPIDRTCEHSVAL